MESTVWDALTVRPELVEWIDLMKQSGEEAPIVLRGLYRLHFDMKPYANTKEKIWTLGEAFQFKAANCIPIATDRQIISEEREASIARRAAERPDPEARP